jgi:NAD(P)-dependent dehydrogenase (short-subunit alcohol dehydrogenase family)
MNGGEALVVASDVSQAADVDALVAVALERFGRIDHVFNNAGIQGSGGPIVDMAEASFDELIAITSRDHG